MRTFSHEEIMEFAGISWIKEMSTEDTERFNKKYDDAQEELENLRLAYKTLSHSLNVMSSHKNIIKAILTCIIQDHRTLQQSFWGFIFALIEEYGKLEEGRYSDGRNEASLKACKKIAQFIKTESIYLPLI
jgi:hypothetical protein